MSAWLSMFAATLACNDDDSLVLGGVKHVEDSLDFRHFALELLPGLFPNTLLVPLAALSLHKGRVTASCLAQNNRDKHQVSGLTIRCQSPA